MVAQLLKTAVMIETRNRYLETTMIECLCRRANLAIIRNNSHATIANKIPIRLRANQDHTSTGRSLKPP